MKTVLLYLAWVQAVVDLCEMYRRVIIIDSSVKLDTMVHISIHALSVHCSVASKDCEHIFLCSMEDTCRQHVSDMVQERHGFMTMNAGCGSKLVLPSSRIVLHFSTVR